MSAKHTKRSSPGAPSRGRADLERVRGMTEEEIAETSPPEISELPDDFWEHAEVVVPEPKEAISLRVDRDVLAWFRESGPRYQTRMNEVLRSYVGAMKRREKRIRSRRSSSSGEDAS